jgi:hypothetical protein
VSAGDRRISRVSAVLLDDGWAYRPPHHYRPRHWSD